MTGDIGHPKKPPIISDVRKKRTKALYPIDHKSLRVDSFFECTKLKGNTTWLYGTGLGQKVLRQKVQTLEQFSNKTIDFLRQRKWL